MSELTKLLSSNQRNYEAMSAAEVRLALVENKKELNRIQAALDAKTGKSRLKPGTTITVLADGNLRFDESGVTKSGASATELREAAVQSYLRMGLAKAAAEAAARGKDGEPIVTKEAKAGDKPKIQLAEARVQAAMSAFQTSREGAEAILLGRGKEA